MGKLDYLEVENFKSYKGKQKIGPFYKFSAVIGPNGAGKSNLMDAISFVLGVKSAHLRSSSLKDLVYRGLQDSTDPEDAPSSGYVIASYIKNDGTRVEFKRTVNINGQSEYFCDGIFVTYSTYNQMLEEEKILVRARNFLVFQGDIETVANQAPKDLTKLIEQISGSIEYKQEYDDYKAMLGRANEESAYNFSKKRGMQAEVKQIEDQKAEAEKFQEINEQKTQLVVEQLLYRLFHIEEQFTATEAELSKEDDHLSKLKNQLVAKENESKDLKVKEGAVKLDIKRVSNHIKEKEAEYAQKLPGVLTIQETILHSQAKISRIQENIAKVKRDFQRQNETVNELGSNLEASNRALEQHEQEARRIQERDLSPSDISTYNQLRQEFLIKTSSLQQELDILERPEKLLSDQVEAATQNVKQIEHRLERANDAKIELNDRNTEINNGAKHVKEEISKAETELSRYIAEKNKIEQEEKELNEKLTKVLNDLVQSKVDERTSERELKLKEGLETLKRIFPGVHGRLVDLIKPSQKKYETAILTTLGRDLNAVLVDQESTAVECIKYLKEQRLGTTKFIPLDTITAPQIQDKHRHYDGASLTIDVIQYDPAFERAVLYSCGNSIVCDNFDIARHICFQLHADVQAVTLDGTVISRSGLITGGGVKGLAITAGAKRWEEKKIEELKQQKDNLLMKLNEIQRSKRRGNLEEILNAKLSGLRSNRDFLAEEKNKVSRSIESNQQEIDIITGQLKDAKSSLENLNEKLREAQTNSSEVRAKIHVEQDAIFSEFCRRLNIPNIRDYESYKMRSTRLISERNLKYRSAVSKLENMYQFESQRLEETNMRLNQLIKLEEQEMSSLNDERRRQAGLISESEKIKNDISKLQNQANQLRNKLVVESGKVQEGYRSQLHLNNLIDATIKSITVNETKLNKLDVERSLILRRCKFENIPIPLTSLSSLDDFDALQTDRLNLRREFEEEGYSISALRPKKSDWTVTLNFSSLSKQDRRSFSEEKLNELEGKVARLNTELDKMAPNLKAIDKLRDVQRRSEATDKEFKKAREQANEARRRFNEARQERFNRFSNAFQVISERINSIYKELTTTPTNPSGGTAYLSLENNDEPYLSGIKYHAMPPSKRFREMELLSGGEKSVAALALLFAIHSYQPAPFFVLDEVDAALDAINVNTVASYLRKLASKDNSTQFIVISLKPQLFVASHSLVGVCRDQKKNSSMILTLDLEQYPRKEGESI